MVLFVLDQLVGPASQSEGGHLEAGTVVSGKSANHLVRKLSLLKFLNSLDIVGEGNVDENHFRYSKELVCQFDGLLNTGGFGVVYEKNPKDLRFRKKRNERSGLGGRYIYCLAVAAAVGKSKKGKQNADVTGRFWGITSARGTENQSTT